jgi:PEP-CTERM motif
MHYPYVNSGAAKFFACSTLFACLLISPATANSIVAPAGTGSTDGNSNNVTPFSAGWFGLPSSARYQQVYASSLFGSTIDIGSIAFRLDGNDAPGPFEAIFPSIQIDLSTITPGPDQLSSTFSENVGANDSIVYDGSLTVDPSGGASPNPFNFVINLQTPFLYNPAQGNLLLDIRINAPSSFPVPALDAVFTSGDGVSRVWSPNDGSVSSLIGNVDTIGLVTEFSSAQATPEPSAMVLVGIGLVLVTTARWKLRQAR